MAEPDRRAPPPADALPAALGVAVFEHLGDRRFRPVGQPAPSVVGAMEEVEPGVYAVPEGSYLSFFLDDAQAAWDAGGTLDSGTFSEPGPDGATRILEGVAFTLDAADGPREMLRLGPPVFRFETTQQLLQRARDEALSVDRARRRADVREVLLHCIVHDLASPLASIKGAMELLLDDPAIGDENREAAAIAARQAETMRELIRNVLGAFAAEADPLRPGAAGGGPPVDVARAVRDAAEGVGARARRAGVAVEVVAPDAPLPAVADERLERVLANLIDNALRHSPDGGTLRLCALRRGDRVVVEVKDDGPGVAPASVPHLFTRFSQHGGRPGSAGLGLYFCRMTAEAWGGTMAYEPRDGGGARFVLALRPADAAP